MMLYLSNAPINSSMSSMGRGSIPLEEHDIMLESVEDPL